MGLAVLAGLVYALVHQLRKTGFRWQVLVSTVASLQWQWLAAAVLFALASYYGRALRWRVLLEPLHPNPSVWGLFSATIIGFTAITLLGRAGEFVRPYLIAARNQVPFSSQIAAWVLERIYDLLIALLIFGFGLSQVRASGASVGPALAWTLQVGGWVVGVTCILCLALLLAIRHYSDRLRKRIMDALGFLSEHHLGRAERMLQALVQGVESTRSDRAILLLVGYTLLEWVIIAGCYFCIAKAFGDAVHFRFVDVVIFMGFTSFGAVVQIPGIGGGVQVVSVLVLTQLFEVPIETATAMAALIWIITFVVIVPFGIGLSFYEGVSWRKIRKLEREI
ncbi:MAG: flippase-like domain-containing protein [Candidatus Solibacter usitatus]|nr:flippase-like domain-containing protein [Candidatus Solibacter usitatus]